MDEESKNRESMENSKSHNDSNIRYILGGLVVIIGVLAFLLMQNMLVNPGPNSGDVGVYYLMPVQCSDCDSSSFKELMSGIGVDSESVVSDSVSSPMIFMVYDGRSTLALANSRLNILSALCEFTDNLQACNLKEDYVFSAQECLKKNNISEDAIIFYTQGECEPCSQVLPFVRSLRDEGYSFEKLDLDSSRDMAVAEECLSGVLDLEGQIPQFACTSNARVRLGGFESEEELRAFAQNCKST